MLRLVVLLLCAVFVPSLARADATPWVGNAHAAARLITAEAATGSAARIDAGLEIRLAPGWHAYWRTPGDAGVPPSIDWKGSDNLAGAETAWPAPHRLIVSGLQNAIYADHVVLPLALTLTHPGSAARLRAAVDYAACAEICVPYHADFALVLPAGVAQPAPEAPLIAAARAVVPGGLASSGLRLVSADVFPMARGAELAVTLHSDAGPLVQPDLFVEGLDQIAPGPPAVSLSAGEQVARMLVALPGLTAATVAGKALTFTVVEGGRSASFAAVPVAVAAPAASAGFGELLATIGIAVLGGLVLNVMPCVLPVLSLKLLSVASHAGAGRRRVRAGLLSTAAGVVFSFAALALALIGLQAAGASIGWGIQFQQPWFLAAMALVTIVFAASLWDWLPIGLPGSSALAALHARHPWADAFLTGAFVTLLATPCSAPFVGTAIGFALARGPAQIGVVFVAMGLGMALPYLLVAAVPGLAMRLPRPGRWMILLRRCFGLLLAGTSIWLLWVLAQVAGPAAAATAALALGLLMLLLAGQGRIGAASRALAVGLAAVAVLVPALAGPPAASGPSGGSVAVWRPIQPAGIAPLVARGGVVFVDVTAAWCLTCKVNDLAVLARDPVARRLHGPGVAAVRVDWTRPDPDVAAFLNGFGRYGVPLDVVYGPAHPEGIALPELLTAGIVTRAIDQASGPRASGTQESGLAHTQPAAVRLTGLP